MSEMLGTLFKYLFALLGIGAVLGILYSVVGDNKSGDFVTQTAQLAGNVQQLYAGQNSFASLTNTVLVNTRSVPNGMLSGSNMVNPWGGTVTVAPNADASLFDITTTQVPDANCAKVATSITTYSTLTINGTAFTPPADAGSVATACSSGSDTLDFTFSG